jgi:hypothetical protein
VSLGVTKNVNIKWVNCTVYKLHLTSCFF